jgi:solute carrier family 25 citrate transporter 1
MPPAQKKTWISLAAGGVGGAVECCCTWPMEYLKTQLQSFRTVRGGPAPPFSGIASGLRYTMKQRGFFALYTGLTPVLIFSAPKAGVRFGANQFFRNQLADTENKVSMGLAFVSGLCAGICEATLVVTPQETIKTKLINLNMGLEGVPHLLKTEGLAGLYAGLGATCLKQGGNQGSRFLFMAQWRQLLTGDAEAKLPKHLTFAGGLGAGLFSVVTTAPFDVVKTRLQGTEAPQYSSTMDCFAQILRKEGPLAFFNGALARAARVVPGQGIIFLSVDVVYDQIAGLAGEASA